MVERWRSTALVTTVYVGVNEEVGVADYAE